MATECTLKGIITAEINLEGIITAEINLKGTLQATVQLTGTLDISNTEVTEYATEQDIIDIFKGE